MRICVCGVHTDVGKTSVSAALCYCYGFDYFKVVQAGSGMYNGNAIQEDRDRILDFTTVKVFDNGVTLRTPVSPHIAMKLDGKIYNGLEIKLPDSDRLLIETAGGLFTPLDLEHCMIDFVKFYNLPVVLVASDYLGSINHTLLSIEALRQRDVTILCGIFSGHCNCDVLEFIYNYSGVRFFKFDHYASREEFARRAIALKEDIQNSDLSNCLKL